MSTEDREIGQILRLVGDARSLPCVDRLVAIEAEGVEPPIPQEYSNCHRNEEAVTADGRSPVPKPDEYPGSARAIGLGECRGGLGAVRNDYSHGSHRGTPLSARNFLFLIVRSLTGKSSRNQIGSRLAGM